MKSSLLFKKLSSILLLFFVFTLTFGQTNQPYKISSNNMVINSTLATDAGNWTINNSTLPGIGWRWENVLIYGQYLFIDRPGVSTASPTLNATPCTNAPKVVRFKYQNANTGKFTFNVKLGGQTIATITENGAWAQSIMTLPSGVTTVSINRTFLSEGTVNPTGTQYKLDNNIWHVIELYVPNYTTGGTDNNLVFENNGNTGMSRQQRIDDVQLFEAIPTPLFNGASLNLANCTTTTANLNDVTPKGIVNGINYDNYTYSWYTNSAGTGTALTAAQVAAAPLGTYYLFATPKASCGNNTVATISNVSGTVTVNPSTDPTCTPVCERSVVQDGGFDQTDASDSPTGYLVPKGDNINNGGTYWKRNFTDKDNQFHITNNSTYSLTNSIEMVGNAGIQWDRALYQQNTSICRGVSKTIKFDFVVYGQGDAITNQGPFQIWLTPTVANLTQAAPFSSSTGVMVAEFYYDGNNYPYNSVNHTGGKWIVGTTASGVTVKVNGVNAIINSTEYNYQTKYSIEISVPENLANAYGGIGFLGDSYVGWLLDNVSVTVSPPAALAPSVTSATVACGSTYNLTTANPTNANYTYEWYEDAAGTIKVGNPTAVTLGSLASKTYYVKTLNCNSCGTVSATPFTLTSNCAFVTGKVFADYDGSANGVNNSKPDLGQSAGLYAHLVDSTGKVITSVKINGDGTYQINATAGAGNFRVFVTNTQLANGTAAPATATMNPNYKFTQSSTIGSTAYSGITTGYSPNFTIAAGTTVSGVNFGVTSNPISADAGGTACTPGAGQPYQMPTLYGVSDDPNFNSGIGQKIIIYTNNFSATNGTLAYNGTAIDAGNLPFTIASYDPALLTFTPTTAEAASVNFEYTFETAAGAQSVIPGIVDVQFMSAGIVSANQQICSGTAPAALSVTGNSGTVQWQQSTDNANFTNIAGATGNTYQPGQLSQTTYYRTVPTDPLCSTTYSNVVTIRVSAASAAVAPSLSQSNIMIACGTTPAVANASGITAANNPDEATMQLGFFTGAPSAATLADKTQLAPGTYKTAYYDPVAGCYSANTTDFIVYKELCVNTPAAVTTFTGAPVNRDLAGPIGASGGSGTYTYSIVTTCTAPAGATALTGVTLSGSIVSYTAPSTAGTYYYCVEVCDDGALPQCKTVTVTVNVTQEAVFACDNSVYLSKFDAANNVTNIYRVVHNADSVDVSLIGTSVAGIHLNDIAYNVNDNKLYGIGSHGILKVITNAANNAVAEVFPGTPVAGLPETSPGYWDYNAGGFYNGKLYVQAVNANNTLYAIDIVNNSATSVTLSSAVDMGDFVYSSVASAFVGYDNSTKKMVKIDPATGNVTFMPYANSIVNEMGAVYTGGLGHLYGKDGTTGTLYEFNLVTGQAYKIYQSSDFLMTQYDGAHCPTAAVTFPVQMSVQKTANQTSYVPGDRITYTVTVTNQSPIYAVNNVTVTDNIPTALTGVTYYATPSAGATSTITTSATAPAAGNTLSDTAYIPVGGSIVYTITGTATAAGTISNTASIATPANFTLVSGSVSSDTAAVTTSVCYKPANTAGVTLPVNHGITAFGRAGAGAPDNWPMVRNGAYTALEANTKGFVINRLTTAQIDKIVTDGKAVEGMAAYDVTVNCFKIYDGTSFKCYTKPSCDQ